MIKNFECLIDVLRVLEKELHVIINNMRTPKMEARLNDLESDKNSKSKHDVDAILGIDTSTGSVESYFDDLEQLKKTLAREVDGKVIRISIRKIES